MVDKPEEYKWSSAAAHLVGPGAERIPLLDWTYWSNLGGGEEWKRRLEMTEDVRDVQRLRRATYVRIVARFRGFRGGNRGKIWTSMEGSPVVQGRMWEKPKRGQGGLLQYRQDEKV